MKRLPILVLVLSTASLPAATASAAMEIPQGDVSRLDEAADLLTPGSLARDVRLAASLDGFSIPDPTRPFVQAPVGTPSAIAAPVATLLGAVQRATELAHGAVRADTEGLARLQARGEALLARSRLAPETDDLLGRARRFELRMDSLIDREAMYGASLELASAIDMAVPALRSYAAASRPSSTAVVGCDILEQPMLCIGGTGANTYTQDVALQVDLGGDDVYRNSAGGADPVPTLGNGIPVSVAIDVAGNDRYEASFPLASKARAVQGGGTLGGIGFLVDAAGDDSYLATGPGEQLPISPQPAPTAQGYALAGVGVLLDAAGSDSYTVTDSTSGYSSAAGQGTTSLGVLGLLVDRGAAPDSYLVESRSRPQVGTNGIVAPGSISAIGQGAGYLGGVGILVDDGGDSAITAEGSVEPIDPQDRRLNSLSVGHSYAHGSGALSGLGVALAGAGDTTWASTLEIGAAPNEELQGSSGVFSQGSGNLGAEGALLDVGGDDTYLTSMVARAERSRVVRDGEKEALVEAYSPDVYNESQGLGSLGGTGVLEDLEGNDTYEAIADTSASATVHDDRSGAPVAGEKAAQAIASSLFTRNYVQGVSSTGVGVLWDHAGDDSYTAETSTGAETTATASSTQRTTIIAPSPGRANTWAQGAAFGAGKGQLVDLAGADRYSSSTSALGTSLPDGATFPGDMESSSQGSSVGDATFVVPVAFLADLGTGADTFFTSPQDAACEGTRGQGRWKDCGPGYSGGFNQ